MSYKRIIIGSFGALAMLASCDAGDTSASEVASSSAALTEDGSATSLAVGQRARIVFKLAAPSEVAEVAIADGDFGPGFGRFMEGGPMGTGQPGEHDANDVSARGGLHGAVEAVDIDAGELRLLGVDVLVNVSTTYVGVTSLADIAAGLMVSVQGAINAEGAFVASAVRVPAPVLSGTITALSTDPATVITVLGRAVTLSADTKIVVVTRPARPEGGRGGRGGMGGFGPGTGLGINDVSGEGE